MSEFLEPSQCRCFAALEGGGTLQPYTITRRALGAEDVVISIKFAGICHSDIHNVNQDWGPGTFPMVPGHEIGGVVAAVGSAVENFSIGDTVGIGCFVDSCRSCTSCTRGFGNYCKSGMVFTYNSKAKYPHCAEYNEDGGAPTYGGYSETIVVNKGYVLKIPKTLDLARATPLLCAGITSYSPLKHYGLKAGMRFGVVGLGGLGHMGVKFGLAMGAHTTVISRGTAKKEDALSNLHASDYLDSTDAAAVAAAACSFDFILDTVSASHDINALMGLLDLDGKYIIVGIPPEPMSVHAFNFILPRRTLAGSVIGGIPETQEMLDFCGEHNITCDIELIDPSYINEAYKRTVASDVKYRFVIDNSKI